MYTFQFATKAQYSAAKASGGAIYAALFPSPAAQTGNTVNVSRSVVSFIAELGTAVTDSVNLCVPYEQGGLAGDVLYSDGTDYFWMKNPLAVSGFASALASEQVFDLVEPMPAAYYTGTMELKAPQDTASSVTAPLRFNASYNPIKK